MSTLEYPLPFDDGSVVIRLEDGRVARVVRSHHASPRERWQMYRNLRATKAEYINEGNKMSAYKRWRLNMMFLSTVLNPNCQACWYGISDS